MRSDRLLAVIRRRDAVLVDLALTPHFVDRVGWARVRVCDSRGPHEVEVTRIHIAHKPTSLQIEGVVRSGEPLAVTTRYRIDDATGQLAIDTWLTNRGSRIRYQVSVCDHFGLAAARVFVPGRGNIEKRARLWTAWAAQSEGELSFALVAQRGRRMLLDLRPAPPAGAFDPALAAYHRAVDLAPRATTRTSRILVAVRGPLHRAAAVAWRYRRRSLRTIRLSLPEHATSSRVLVERDHKPVVWLPAARKLELALPRGAGYSALVWSPGIGRATPASIPPRGEAKRQLVVPPYGTLEVQVVDVKGHPMPAKLRLKRSRGSLVTLGRDGGLRSDDTIYTDGNSRIALAPGRYAIEVSRGPEYRRARRSATVRAAKVRRLRLRLARAVQSPGWIAADLHLHSSASFDSPLGPRARLLSAAATGVELAVISDHNTVTDLSDTRAQRNLRGEIVAWPGQEVTTKGYRFGHFNVFPLPVTRVLPWYRTTPRELFAAARAVRGALIQVNHPAMGRIGYFHQLRLDPTSGRASQGYDPGFQLLEVFNGDHLDAPAAVGRMVRRWFALLDRGRRYVATAGSDGHRLPMQDPGYPRTYVLWNEHARHDDDATRAVGPKVVEALAAGRAFISTGPLLRFSIAGKPIGSLVTRPARTDKADHAPSARRSAESADRRPLTARIAVDAAPWVDVRRVELIASGRVVASFRVRGRSVHRFSRAVALEPERDSWYVVRVRGERPDPTQSRRVLPYALSNPIWVDVDGDGRFTPPHSNGTQAKRAAESAGKPTPRDSR